ncbi:MAG TPA: FMN-binding protein [Acidimicrobiales bacterium]|nr:FMN-binding protein [Acidimicrobiales bacterium]
MPPTHTTTPSGTTSSAAQSATGSMEQYGYGQLAVDVTVRASSIIGLQVVGLQTAESYSQQIATQVIPMLKGEVLSAQSLQVNGISGATYTTEAYLYSIQSALSRLHFK